MATPVAADLPPWHSTLLAIPTADRTRSQRDLVRGLELADEIKRCVESPLPMFLADPRTTDLLLGLIETYLLGPFSFSALTLLDEALTTKLRAWVKKLTEMSHDLFKESGGRLREGQTAEALAEQALAAVLIIVQHILFTFSSYSADACMPDFFNFFFFIFEKMDSASDSLDEMDRFYAASGSGVRFNVLKKFVIFMRPAVLIAGNSGYDVIEPALAEMIASLAGDTPRPWRVVAMYEVCKGFSRFFNWKTPPKTCFGVRLSSMKGKEMISMFYAAAEAFSAALERAVAAAEAAGDDAALALSAGYLARIWMSGMNNKQIASIQAVAEKAAAALDRARPTLPKTYRILLSVDDILENLPSGPGPSFIGNSALRMSHMSMYTPDLRNATPIGTYRRNAPVVRTCGNCGAKSPEHLVCSGCLQIYFCSQACSKLHWKAGHKHVCKELKAKREAEREATVGAAGDE